MMRIAILVGALLLVGCGSGDDIAVSMKDWSCTKVSKVESLTLTPTGKTAMLLPSSSIECVQWTRMSEQL